MCYPTCAHNKAARGELRRGLPIGLVWGEGDGEILLHPDEAVRGAIATCFERFAERGSVRGVWLWFRQQGLGFPTQTSPADPIRWVAPTYTAIHDTLTNPAYAGAYAYGKTRHERFIDPAGRVRVRTRRLEREAWAVLIPEHHPGYVEWPTFLAIGERIGRNIRPRPHTAGGAVREGAALLQGLAVCGRCGRRLHVHYSGRASTPGYHCAGRDLVEGWGRYCLSVGGRQIEDAVARAFCAALAPVGIEAAIACGRPRARPTGTAGSSCARSSRR